MIEILPNLFVGSQEDEAAIRGQAGWFVIHACKEPYHRQALAIRARERPSSTPNICWLKGLAG